MIQLNSIDHVCLWVRSLDEANGYYSRLFDVECSLRENNDSCLVVESNNLHFFICEYESENDFLPKQHLSFAVDNLNKVIESLKNLNIVYSIGEIDFFKQKNYKWCEWRDPSGIRLECVEYI